MIATIRKAWTQRDDGFNFTRRLLTIAITDGKDTYILDVGRVVDGDVADEDDQKYLDDQLDKLWATALLKGKPQDAAREAAIVRLRAGTSTREDERALLLQLLDRAT